jgi:hypothetical protein
MEERMSDDIDWKAKCRKVAEWMGEVGGICDVPDEVVSSRHFVAWKDESPPVWPKYHEDDAHAWRLLMAIASGPYVHAEWHPDFSEFRVVKHLEYEDVLAMGSETGDAKKAIVLAACQLIDKGIEPKEST